MEFVCSIQILWNPTFLSVKLLTVYRKDTNSYCINSYTNYHIYLLFSATEMNVGRNKNNNNNASVFGTLEILTPKIRLQTTFALEGFYTWKRCGDARLYSCGIWCTAEARKIERNHLN